MVVLDGTMDRRSYTEIMWDQWRPWTAPFFGHNFVFAQVNAPPQTAVETTAFIVWSGVEVLDRPAGSPHTNPFEHVWDWMSVWIRDMDHTPSNVAEPQQIARQVWRAVERRKLWVLRSVSISDKTSYRKISWSLEVARIVFRIVRSLWKLIGTSSALLPMCLKNSKAMRWFKLAISRLRVFTRAYD